MNFSDKIRQHFSVIASKVEVEINFDKSDIAVEFDLKFSSGLCKEVKTAANTQSKGNPTEDELVLIWADLCGSELETFIENFVLKTVIPKLNESTDVKFGIISVVIDDHPGNGRNVDTCHVNMYLRIEIPESFISEAIQPELNTLQDLVETFIQQRIPYVLP